MNAQKNNKITTITWFKEFIGVGYDFYDIHVNVFPLFKDKRYATDLWEKTFERMNGNQIKIRFVEHELNYWFIAYTSDSEANIGFVKNFAKSENFHRFKDGFDEKVILHFGIYKENDEHAKINKVKKCHLDLLRKSKLVQNVKIMELPDLSSSTLERKLIENNGLSR